MLRLNLVISSSSHLLKIKRCSELLWSRMPLLASALGLIQAWMHASKKNWGSLVILSVQRMCWKLPALFTSTSQYLLLTCRKDGFVFLSPQHFIKSKLHSKSHLKCHLQSWGLWLERRGVWRWKSSTSSSRWQWVILLFLVEEEKHAVTCRSMGSSCSSVV